MKQERELKYVEMQPMVSEDQEGTHSGDTRKETLWVPLHASTWYKLYPINVKGQAV
jgi:hypothetical protein